MTLILSAIAGVELLVICTVLWFLSNEKTKHKETKDLIAEKDGAITYWKKEFKECEAKQRKPKK